MPADAPTILATSGGLRDGRRAMVGFGPLVHHAVELAGVTGRAPRVAYLGTAIGDQEFHAYRMFAAAAEAGFDLTEIRLFSQPNHDDIEARLLEQDVVWVMGGSVVNLLAVWRAHGLDQILRRVWQSGVVLTGISAGSLCWYQGGTTDSFGPLRAVTNGLGLLPYGNGVHYDSEPGRRPLMHDLVRSRVFAEAHCTDDGVGLLYRGTDLVEAVTEVDGKRAWLVRQGLDGVEEEAIEARRL